MPFAIVIVSDTFTSTSVEVNVSVSACAVYMSFCRRWRVINDQRNRDRTLSLSLALPRECPAVHLRLLIPLAHEQTIRRRPKCRNDGEEPKPDVAI